jgi:uncharacterized protein
MPKTESVMSSNSHSFAMVTRASTGIGYELARCYAANGFDFLIAADEAAINLAADDLRRWGVSVETVQAELAGWEGIDLLCEATR